MIWKNFEELTSSDVAEKYFEILLSKVKAEHSPRLYCSLKEEINGVKTSGLIVDEHSSKVVRASIALPLSADFFFRIKDTDYREIGASYIGHVPRVLDEDNRFLGYSEGVRKALKHQAGVRLKHLMPLNREIYFLNDIEDKRYINVDESLIERLVTEEFEEKLDTIHVQ